MGLLVAGASLVVASCGGSPAAAVPSPIPEASGIHSLSGTVVGNQDRQPIAGATLRITQAGQSTVTTDDAGRFSLSSVPDGISLVELSAPGHLAHVSRMQMTGSRTEVTLDLISMSPPFSLEFYRQFAGNGHESSVLQPIRPWTMAPSFYLRTVTEDTGEEIPARIVESIERVVLNSVPELSGGRLAVRSFQTGREPRTPQTGWVNVTLVHDASLLGGGAALATVGDTGTISLHYDSAQDTSHGQLVQCDSLAVWGVDHEIVHIMGFYHTASDGSEFHSPPGCAGAGRPSIARHHAAVMYSRPRGNVDPDSDSGVSYLWTAADAPQPVVTCHLPIADRR